jgi:SOS response regulatory protein OraA/RecX
VDGEPWRTVPDEVVLRCGLTAGVELERPLLRRLRAELRNAEALALASRALRRRDLSRRRLAERLEHAGVTSGAERHALTTLTDAGAVDDARLARVRASSLADRGWADAAIAARLAAEGITDPEAGGALEGLPPEAERAAELAAGVGDPRKAWALLSRRGFDPETIEAAVGPLDDQAPEG